MKATKTGIIIVSIFLMFFNFLLPPLGGLEREGMSVCCIFVGTILLLVTVDLMWPVLLCVLAFATNNIYSLTEALQKSFGDDIFWFVAFVSIMLFVLKGTGVLWRISTALFRLKIVKTHPWLFLACVFEFVLLLGCFLEPATLTMVFLALFGNIFEQLKIRKGDRFAELIIMGVLLFAGMSYGTTPLAHPVVMVVIETFQPVYSISMAGYTLAGLVLGTCAVAVYMLMLKFIFRLDIQRLKQIDSSDLKHYGPMTREEKTVTVVYLTVIILWLLPTFLPDTAGGLAGILNGMGVIGPAMAGAAVLCMISVKGKPLAEMVTMLKEAVPWKACFPIAASMLLGGALSSEEVGIVDVVSSLLGPVLQTLPLPLLVLTLALFCALFTNFTSNAISAMLASTLCVVFIESGIMEGIHAGALIVILGFCANCAFMYPSGSTYAAIVSGSGWVRMKTQIREGLLHSVILTVLACTVGYGFTCLVL